MATKKIKEWRGFNDQCLHCGGDAEVFTDTGFDNCAYDVDHARCTECGCPGFVSIGEEGEDSAENLISWHDEPGCRCEWCLKNYDEQGNPIP
jgi:hypothetical protein